MTNTYAILVHGVIQVRALPSMRVARRLAPQYGTGAKAIVDPRCIRER